MVMFIGVMVTALAFTVLRSSTGRFYGEEAALGSQRNLRETLGLIVKEARMAGNGLSLLGPGVDRVQFYGPTNHELVKGKLVIERSLGWYKNPDAASDDLGAMGIYGTDGGLDGADSLTVFSSEIEKPSPLGRLEVFKLGELKLEDPVLESDVKRGDIVAAVSGRRAVLFEVEKLSRDKKALAIKRNGRFTFTMPPRDFGVEGALLFNLRNVAVTTYFLNEKTSTLMVDRHDQSLTDYDDPAQGAQAVAENVSDFQVYYFFENDPVELSNVTMAPNLSQKRFAGEKVKALAVAVTAVSAFNSKQTFYRRPALFNREAGKELGGRKYSSLMETVFLRN
jgi:hypothetical protein